MNRIDSRTLTDLEAEARLAELRIERLPMREITNLDMENLTCGELIVLADVVSAVQTLTEFREKAAQKVFVERRSSEAAEAPDREEMIRRIRSYLAGPDGDDAEIQTVNGPMRYGDVPRDAAGNIPSEWVAANCMCDEHTRKRAASDPGLYL